MTTKPAKKLTLRDELFRLSYAQAVKLLQAANTVINVDLPWNPALLEQRIARAHRMGQQRPVHVYILVTEETLEEGLLGTLSAKKELAIAALDPDTDIDQVDLTAGIDELKQRLEVLIGAAPERSTDKSMRQESEQMIQRQQNIADADGQLVTAAFRFLNEVLPGTDENPQTKQLGEEMAQRLSDCLQPAADGGLQLSINLPDQAAVTTLANTLAPVLTITAKSD